MIGSATMMPKLRTPENPPISRSHPDAKFETGIYNPGFYKGICICSPTGHHRNHNEFSRPWSGYFYIYITHPFNTQAELLSSDTMNHNNLY